MEVFDQGCSRMARGERGNEARTPRGRGEGLPPALEVGVDNRALAVFVLETVRGVADAELFPPAVSQSAAFQPRAMLVMLAYCYAIGVYGSWDIEQMMYEDADFRALCGRDYPDWRRFRRFRRDNHAVLRRTLEETFRRIRSSSSAASQASNRDREMIPARANDGSVCTPSSDWLADEAEARIERAMFIDQMAAETA